MDWVRVVDGLGARDYLVGFGDGFAEDGRCGADDVSVDLERFGRTSDGQVGPLLVGEGARPLLDWLRGDWRGLGITASGFRCVLAVWMTR
jgi:hypothetical protein